MARWHNSLPRRERLRATDVLDTTVELSDLTLCCRSKRSCNWSNTVTTCTYGSDGLRRRMSVSSGMDLTITDYVLDGQNVAQDIVRNEQNEVTGKTTYIYGPRGAECCIKKTIDPETGQVTDEKWRWYVLDGLGSVLAEADESGDLKAARRHDVYGNYRLDGEYGTSESNHKLASTGNLPRQGFVLQPVCQARSLSRRFRWGIVC